MHRRQLLPAVVAIAEVVVAVIAEAEQPEPLLDKQPQQLGLQLVMAAEVAIAEVAAIVETLPERPPARPPEPLRLRYPLRLELLRQHQQLVVVIAEVVVAVIAEAVLQRLQRRAGNPQGSQ